ncbi:MAG: hypothetical protein ACW99Q_29005, partial [Candidatus Kariarchaeaceae archaeon]
MQSWSSFRTIIGSVVKVQNVYYAFYRGNNQNVNAISSIGLATSSDGENWTPNSENPIIPYSIIPPGNKTLGRPWCVYVNNQFRLFFHSDNQWRYATSSDAINWTIDFNPSINLPIDVQSIIYESGMFYAVRPLNNGEIIEIHNSVDGFNWSLFGSGDLLPYQIWQNNTQNFFTFLYDPAQSLFSLYFAGGFQTWGMKFIGMATGVEGGVASISVINPNDGEKLLVDETHEIIWATSGNIENVNIFLNRYLGNSWEPLFSNIPNSGSQSWTISGFISDTCFLRIESVINPTIFDISDNPFKITNNTDLNFRAYPDGFSFENPTTERTWDMFRNFFGASNVEYPDGSRRIFAEIYFNEKYKSISDGSCIGISVCSILNYFTDFDQSNAGIYEFPPGGNSYIPLYGAGYQPEMEPGIAYYHGVQRSVDFDTNFLNQDTIPSIVFSRIENFLENDVPIIIAYTNIQGKEGHALVPYKLERFDNNERGRIWVYDSNTIFSQDSSRMNSEKINFNFNTESWIYVNAVQQSWWSHAPKSRIYPIPVMNLMGPGVLIPAVHEYEQFIVNSTGGETTIPVLPIIFEDENGNVFGYINQDSLVEEIPGAFLAPSFEGFDIVSPNFYIPREEVNNIELHGDTSGFYNFTILSDSVLIYVDSLKI